MTFFRPYVVITAFTAAGLATDAVESQTEPLNDLRHLAKNVQQACDGQKPWTAIASAARLEKEARNLLPKESIELANYLELAAFVFRHTNRQPDAESLFREVLDLRRLQFKADGGGARAHRVGLVLHQLASDAGKRGSPVEAVGLFRETLEILSNDTDESKSLRASALSGMAVQLALMGDLNAATEMLEQAKTIGGALPNPPAMIIQRINVNMASVYIERARWWRQQAITAPFGIGIDPEEVEFAKNPEGYCNRKRKEALKKATDLLVGAANYYDKKPDLTPEEVIEYLNVLRSANHCVAESGRPELAERILEGCLGNLDILKKNSALRGEFQADLGVARFLLGKYEQAKIDISAALLVLEKLDNYARGDISWLKCSYAVVHGISKEQKSFSDALLMARNNFVEQLESIEQAFVFQPDRERLLAQKRTRFPASIFLTLNLMNGPPGEDTAVKLYADLLRWKHLGFAPTEGRGDARTSISRLRRDLQNHAIAYRQCLMMAPRGIAKDEWEAEKTKTRDKLRIAERKLSEARVALEPIGKLTPGEVAKAIPDDMALVDFYVFNRLESPREGRGEFIQRPHALAFISRKNRHPEWVSISLEGLYVPLSRWYKSIDEFKKNKVGAESIVDLHRYSSEIAKIIWQPIANHPSMDNVKQVIIAPDADLWYVPFSALPGRDGKRFLVEEIPISYVLSPRQAVDCLLRRGNYADKPGNGCLVIGAIDYGRGGRHSAIASEPTWTKSTLSTYETLFGKSADKLLAASATVSNVLKELPNGYKEIHLNGHGPRVYGRTEDWLFGAAPIQIPLAMANTDAEGKSQPNSLDAERLTTLNLHGVRAFWPWGCHYNTGMDRAPEGIVGVPRALQIAGCQAVLSSLWDTDVFATKDLSADVNQFSWQSGKSPAQSLRMAQMKYLDRSPADGRNPFFWAGWIVIGDVYLNPMPRPIEPSRPRPNAPKVNEEPRPVEAEFPWMTIACGVSAFVVFCSSLLIAVFLWRPRKIDV